MLQAERPKSETINSVQRQGNDLILGSERGKHRLQFFTESIVRVTYTEREDFSSRIKPGVVAVSGDTAWQYREEQNEIVVRTSALTVRIDRETGSYGYYDAEGKNLLQEKKRGSKTLEEFQTYRLDGEKSANVTRVETADGVKEVVLDASRVADEKLYHTRLSLSWKKGEALYGLGQQEEGLLNLRGQTVYVHQANRKIAVPMLLSSLGYGILVDTYSPMIFNDTVSGSYLYTEADDELDYYFLAGGNMNGVVKQYRYLTGKAAMLPKWAFGYIQSQERYETAQEIQDVVSEYRKREIGLDCIVLDWCSWEDGLWGQKTFDEKRFANPEEWLGWLHDQGVHFMLSIWPTMSRESENYKEMRAAGMLLPASEIYNPLEKEGRELYWKQVERGLFRHGVDAWWCDSSEPLTMEWTHRERREPGVLFAEYCSEMQDHMPAWVTNAFPLYHARTLYEGQRSETDGKRVCNLTRSAYTGQQRYGTIMWSGDISASWETLRNQIACGLSFVATGMPYWTVDIGAFFVKRGSYWYWDGDYDDTTNDAGYLELFTRWYQWGTFLPVFRGHGTDCRRELWHYTGKDNMFYDAMLMMNRLRYQLMPYIYSQAGRVWLHDESMMKMLAFDFSEDEAALEIKDQYMFGDSIMVCPVTEPMYYGVNSEPIERKEKKRDVYLPNICGWYDFWTGEYYEGGQWLEADAPIDKLPLFVKEGSILPMTEAADRVSAKDKITWRVYAGCDAEYLLYEDEGDGYGYEKGQYTCVKYNWSESEKKLRDEQGTEVPAVVTIK